MLTMQVFNTNHRIRAQRSMGAKTRCAKTWAKELLILNKRPGITIQNIKCIQHYHPHNSP